MPDDKEKKLKELSCRDPESKKGLKNFVPTGVIRTANEIRSKHFRRLSSETAMQNVVLEVDASYAWQLMEFYDWFFENIRTDLTVNTLLVKQAIIHVGSIAEALCIFILDQLKVLGKVNRSLKGIKFMGAINTLYKVGVIGKDLCCSLQEMRKMRDSIHIHIGDDITDNSFTENEYFRQRLVLEEFSTTLDCYGKTLTP